MGDRANIVVYDPARGESQSPFEAVFLYTHWSGYDLPEILKAGLERGKDRWTDGPYLARVLFQKLIGNDTDVTGFGISTRLTDNEHPLLVVDIPRQVVVEFPEGQYTEHGFANLGEYTGTPFAAYSGEWADSATV